MSPQDKVRSAESEPTDPKRVRAFAEFFKRYMSISTIVIAALPIPVTSFSLIPTFSAQTKILSVYTPLFCFLILGLIFYLRHQLARIMFHEFFSPEYALSPPDSPEEPSVLEHKQRMRAWRKFLKAALIGLLPLFLIASSVFFVFQYNDNLVNNARTVSDAIKQSRPTAAPTPSQDGSPPEDPASFNAVLKNTELSEIPLGSRLMLLYILIFVSAEAAFVLMAIKEYLQDLVKLSEDELIRGYKSIPGASVGGEVSVGGGVIEMPPPDPAAARLEN